MGTGRMKEATVADLREQSARSDSDRRVVVVTKDPKLIELIKKLRVVQVYPDSTDEYGNFGVGGAFKIEVARDPDK